jgi:hypothetical protein
VPDLEQAFGFGQHPLTEALRIIFRACGCQPFEVSDQMCPAELETPTVGLEIGPESVTAQNSIELFPDDFLEGLCGAGANSEDYKLGCNEDPQPTEFWTLRPNGLISVEKRKVRQLGYESLIGLLDRLSDLNQEAADRAGADRYAKEGSTYVFGSAS